MKLETFEMALKKWGALAAAHAQKAEAYRIAWSTAYLGSTEKTDTARKADADIRTSALRVERTETLLAASEAEHMMLFLRGHSDKPSDA